MTLTSENEKKLKKIKDAPDATPSPYNIRRKMHKAGTVEVSKGMMGQNFGKM